MRQLAPQAAGFQHVGLVHGADLAAAQLGRLEGLAQDALNLIFGIGHGVERGEPFPTVGRSTSHAGLALAGPEVYAASQLAHNHDVHAVHKLRLERGGVLQRVEDDDRAQIRIQTQLLANAQQALLRARSIRVGGVPLRAAHRRQQHGISCLGRLQRGRRQGLAARVNCAAANQRLLILKGHFILLAQRVEHLHGLGNNLRANAVAGQQANLVRFVSHC